MTDLTAISNIIFRVANSKFNYITNCPIAFATTIECFLATGVQFNALHIDPYYKFIRHYSLPEHLLNYNDIDYYRTTDNNQVNIKNKVR